MKELKVGERVTLEVTETNKEFQVSQVLLHTP